MSGPNLPTSWTDEQISAFLDGELPEADSAMLARAVETDARLAARVERLGSANRAYIAAVSQIDARPLPAGVSTILDAPPTAKVLRFPVRKIGAVIMEHRAIAASLLCAAAVWGVASSVSSPLSDPMLPQDGVILASSPLHRALETGASSQPVQLAANVTATPRITFATTDGDFCRQFDVASASGATSAIACRQDGQWRTQVAVFGRPGATGDYQTVSGDKPPALEIFLDNHMSGSPLDATEEKQLVTQGWKRPDR